MRHINTRGLRSMLDMSHGIKYTIAKHFALYSLWSMLDMSHGIKHTAYAKHFEASLG